jgi:DNA-binding MarR family transcriptional regulator
MHDADDRAEQARRDGVTPAELRTANLLGALALRVTERTATSLEDGGTVAGTDAMALIALHNYAEGATLETLRSGLGLSQPGTVRLVDRLAARGLVERRRSERDGRALALHLTAAGRRAVDAALTARASVTTDVLAGLTDGERERLTALLEKMLAAQTTNRVSARRICRLCDGEACGHPERCPVTQAVRS